MSTYPKAFQKYPFLNEYTRFNVQEIVDNFETLKQEDYHFGLKLPYKKCCFTFRTKESVKQIIYMEERTTDINSGIFCRCVALRGNEWFHIGERTHGIVFPIQDNGFRGGHDAVFADEGLLVEDMERFATFFDSIKWIIFCSLLLLNCKNFRPTLMTPCKKLNQIRKKYHKREAKDYYELKIPIHLKPRFGESFGGYAKRMHTCRGHFKNYTEKGLFNKFKGIYWWNNHLKGSELLGKIQKDYKIKSM